MEAEHPLFHPADREQIVKGGEQPVPDAIVAGAREAGVVVTAISETVCPSILKRVGKNRCMPLKNFKFEIHSRLKAR